MDWSGLDWTELGWAGLGRAVLCCAGLDWSMDITLGGAKRSLGKVGDGCIRLFPPGIEPGAFRVLGGCDNHYTTETPVSDPASAAASGRPVGGSNRSD